MKLIFTKGAGKYDQMEVFRPGAAAPEHIDCPKQRIIPHDMMHYAVEHTLDIGGFLSRVKAGEDASFRMKPEAQSDSVERLVEVFQGDEWSGRVGSAPELIDLYRITCEARGCPAIDLDDGAIQAIRAAISALSDRWQKVPVGGALQLQL